MALADVLKGRKVVIFAVPGAFTPTCHSAHVPGFIRVMEGLKEKGVDEVICLAANDPFVMQAWGEATGATAAGIALLSDADGSFADAIGMRFDAAAAGLFARSKRYALAAEDGVVTVWHPETGRGCEISGGEAMLAAL
ncbi:peroxiredoxin [Sinisalibacter aestuarii]|uniref:Glutathione-dependent peroxiredoxin n=1 Tax=Sinisalibacter aestuarii TaxID=2949426 RepID=A0ABQ5LXH3_9RHOB|nr:peroxiredoxin [Sinisalibacter aestuarii]